MATPSRFFPYQTVHLGAVGTIAGLNVTALGNDGTGPWLGSLGMILEDSGKLYRLVQRVNVVDVVTSAGFVAQWSDRANNKVSSKASEAQAQVNGVAGAFLGVVTNNNYCFIQMGGSQSIKTAAAVVAGDKLIGSTTDGQLARIAAGVAVTDETVAVAYGAVASGLSLSYWQTGAML